MDESDMEPMSHVRQQYKAFRMPTPDDCVWEECPVVGLMVSRVVGPDFIEETERYIEISRADQPGGGIVDSLYFAKHPDVVEYVRRRSPGEFGAREGEIPPRFQYTRVTNLTRLVSQTAEVLFSVTQLAEMAVSMEVHRWAPVVLRTSKMTP